MPFALESVESCPLKARAFKMIAKGGKQVQEMKLTSQSQSSTHTCKSSFWPISPMWSGRR